MSLYLNTTLPCTLEKTGLAWEVPCRNTNNYCVKASTLGPHKLMRNSTWYMQSVYYLQTGKTGCLHDDDNDRYWATFKVHDVDK